MNFVVSCKKNIKITYYVFITMLIVSTLACLALALHYLLSFDTATIDEILASLLMLIGTAIFGWGAYNLAYSQQLTIVVNDDVITINRVLKPTMTIDVKDIDNVVFGQHHDSSRYSPKNRYIMRIFAKGEKNRIIEDEMENFDKLCSYLCEKEVHTISEETARLIRSRTYQLK